METVTRVRPVAPEGASLAAIEARLARIERMLEPLAEAAAAAPAGVATLTDIVDDWAARDGNAEARLRALHGLVARLTQPETLAMLAAMVDHAESLPKMVATLVDIADSAAAESARAGVPVEALVQAAGRALRGLSRLATAPEVQALFESGMLAPETLQTLGRVAAAVGDASTQARPMGLMAALRAARDAHVQRAIGFTLTVAREFGRAIEEKQHAPKRLESGHV